MRILVCGGRDYANYKRLKSVMAEMHKHAGITCIIHGGARGADNLAGQFAKEFDIPLEVYRADWNRHGKQAGPIRNAEMLKVGKPDMVLAFPGGNGTAHMVQTARKSGVPAFLIEDRDYNK